MGRCRRAAKLHAHRERGGRRDDRRGARGDDQRAGQRGQQRLHRLRRWEASGRRNPRECPRRRELPGSGADAELVARRAPGRRRQRADRR